MAPRELAEFMRDLTRQQQVGVAPIDGEKPVFGTTIQVNNRKRLDGIRRYFPRQLEQIIFGARS